MVLARGWASLSIKDSPPSSGGHPELHPALEPRSLQFGSLRTLSRKINKVQRVSYLITKNFQTAVFLFLHAHTQTHTRTEEADLTHVHTVFRQKQYSSLHPQPLNLHFIEKNKDLFFLVFLISRNITTISRKNPNGHLNRTWEASTTFSTWCFFTVQHMQTFHTLRFVLFTQEYWAEERRGKNNWKCETEIWEPSGGLLHQL